MYFKNVVSDIRFWIILFFICRLYAITDPPLEIAHNWRQVTVSMSARNFLEKDPNIFYPRVDFAGDKSGITGMEFPVLNYLIYLLSLVFGYAHWYGRLINLAVSSIGIWYFFKIVQKYFTTELAFNAAFFLLFSVWFTYSRKIMPDTFSMSLVLIGIYYGSNYLHTKQNVKNILLYFIFLLLGALSKLPSAYLLVTLCPFLLDKRISIKIKTMFCLVSSVIITFVAFYYFVWVPYLTEHYGFFHFFMGKNLSQGLKEIVNNLERTAEKFYLEALQIFGFLLFLVGLSLAVIRKSKRLLIIFSLCFFTFLVVVFKAGITFSGHSYYIIPFAPIMALVAAYALEELKNRKLRILFLAIILVESVSNKFHDFYIKDEYSAILNLEPQLDKLCGRKDLVLINSGNVPTPLYFAHRCGWIDFNENLSNMAYVTTLKGKGLKYIIVLKKVFGRDMQLNYDLVFNNEDYRIYKL